MSDRKDILLKLFETYNAIRLHNENLSRGSVAAVTGASIVLWSSAFSVKAVPSIILLVASAGLPIVGILLSRKMEHANRDLIRFSNRIRDKHLRALRYNNPEIIPKHWQIYLDEDFKTKRRSAWSWWRLEHSVYAALIVVSLILIYVRFGLWLTTCWYLRF